MIGSNDPKLAQKHEEKIMANLMTKQEIKDRAQSMLLDSGSGALTFAMDYIESLETRRDKMGEAINENELTNEKAVYAEMGKQFDRMVKFFGFVSFTSSH